MNSNIYALLNTVKLIDVIATVLLLVALVGITVTQRKKFKELLDSWRKKRNLEESNIASVTALQENEKKLQSNIDKVWNTMIESREVSKNIRSDIYSDIKEIKNTLIEMEKKNNLSKQADLKERIEKLYRECHENMICTDTAFETMKDLIRDYERHGGENSFVHSLVQKEMYKWKVIETIPNPPNHKGDGKHI